MKVVIVATLAANGSYLRADPENAPPKEIIADIRSRCEAAGCVVVGRSTYELLLSQGQDLRSMAPDVVVVSASLPAEEGIFVAGDIEQALATLEARGHCSAVVTGGATLVNSFLQADRFDEIVFFYAPMLDGGELRLVPRDGAVNALKMLGVENLRNGIVRTHYGRADM